MTRSKRIFPVTSVRNSIFAMTDQFISSVANFVTGVIIGRFCSPDQLGTYYLGLSIIMAVMLFQNSFISAPYSVFNPRLDWESRAKYIGGSLFYQFVISSSTIIVLSIIRLLNIFGKTTEDLYGLIFALSVVIYFILLRELIRQICFANLQYGTAIIVDLCTSVFQIAALIVIAKSGLLNANIAYFIIGASSAIGASFWLFNQRKNISFSMHAVSAFIAKNWTIGRWLFLSGLLWQSNVIIYPWLLAYFHGTASTGVWAACFGTVSIANPFLLGIENLIGPEMAHSFAKGGTNSLNNSVSRMTILFSILIVPFSLVFLFFGNLLITTFYGGMFGGNGNVIIPLALSLLISPARSTISRALVVMGRGDIDFLTNISSVLVFGIAGILMTMKYGPLGVAWAIFIGNIAVAVSKTFGYWILTQKSRTNSESTPIV